MLYSGVTGKISIKKGSAAAIDLVHMANWSISLSKEMIEVVSFGDDYKEKVPAVKDWSGNSDGKVDFSTGGGQAELLTSFEDGTELQASFYLDDETFLFGKCYIESLEISHAADGAAEVSISVAGSGKAELTKPAA